MEYAIRLKGLTKSFSKEKVLKNITHDFEKGKIHGIMGFNGSGNRNVNASVDFYNLRAAQCS